MSRIAFRVKLEGDLLRRQLAVDMLAASHPARVVIEDLVGDVGGLTPQPDGIASVPEWK